MKNEYTQRLNERINELESRKHKIHAYVQSLLENEQKVNTIRGMAELEQSINSAISLGLDDDSISQLSSLLERISNARSIINTFPNQIDLLNELSIPASTPFYAVIENELREHLKKAMLEESVWIGEYIEPIENPFTLSSMISVDCTRWINKTESLPEVLSQETINRYTNARRTVEKQLHQCRIEGVITLFNGLSDDEKRDCLRILNSK